MCLLLCLLEPEAAFPRTGALRAARSSRSVRFAEAAGPSGLG